MRAWNVLISIPLFHSFLLFKFYMEWQGVCVRFLYIYELWCCGCGDVNVFTKISQMQYRKPERAIKKKNNKNTSARRGQLAKLHTMVNDLVFTWLKYHSCLTHNHFSSKWKSSTIDSPQNSGSIYTTKRTRRTERTVRVCSLLDEFRVELTRKWEQYFRVVEVIACHAATGKRITSVSQCKCVWIMWMMCEVLNEKKKCLKSRSLFTFGHESRPKYAKYVFFFHLKNREANKYCYV